jgi:putative DNA primase/helicase
MTAASKRQVRRDVEGVTHDTTDLRNAERLVERHGDDLRYIGTWSKWAGWDARRWVLDDTGGAMRCASDTTRAMVAEALEDLSPARRALDEAEAAPEGEERERKITSAKRKVAAAERLFKWAVQSQGAQRLRAMLDVGKSFAAVVVRHDVLDADAWALNVENGTIDLRTGKLREHRREDLITKIAPVAYDPNAKAPTWDAFLHRAMGGDPELVSYLARVIGYSLTGDVSEHVLGFFFGGGANGKSTFLGAIHAMLGDYASPAPRGLLFRARGERHPTEYATLHGRRFVTCPEVEEGTAFDESLVKDLTGGDPVECRRMREDFWTFTPTHKLFLAGNHKPSVRGDDEGIWRRIRLVPWLVTIPESERDTELPVKLRAELPGILAWAVRGCLAWQERGLATPDVVTEASADYRRENDLLGQFLRLYVAFEKDASVSRKELRELYTVWCLESGAEPLGAKRFTARLRERKVRETSVRVGVKVIDGWRGVRLATEAERVAAAAWAETCRDVGTVGTSSIIDPPCARPHDPVNPDPDSTSHYVPTEVAGGDADENETFSGWLAAKGVVQ